MISTDSFGGKFFSAYRRTSSSAPSISRDPVSVVRTRTVPALKSPVTALLNGFGGGASALVAGDEYLRYAAGATSPALDVQSTIMLTVLIGGITFSGSIIAFAKLQELMSGRPITVPGHNAVNAGLFTAVVVFTLLASASFDSRALWEEAQSEAS